MSRAKSARLFQIEILDFTKPIASPRTDKLVWKNMKNGGKAKVADTLPVATRRTIFKWAKTQEVAQRRAKRFGTVLNCFKVDSTPYKRNIEYLNISEKPIPIVLEEEFTLGKDLSITLKKEKGFQVELDK